MEDILWIIALIVISNILGKGKKRAREQQAQARRQRTKDQISAPAKAKEREIMDAPKKKSIESYFKDMAQEIKRQQDMLAQKAQQEKPAVDVKPFESIEVPVEKTEKKAKKTQREGAYYFDKRELEKKKTVEPLHSAETAEAENPFESLFESPNDIVKGIIYSEILSKPRSLRKD